jgi:hypothetical protein
LTCFPAVWDVSQQLSTGLFEADHERICAKSPC